MQKVYLKITHHDTIWIIPGKQGWFIIRKMPQNNRKTSVDKLKAIVSSYM